MYPGTFNAVSSQLPRHKDYSMYSLFVLSYERQGSCINRTLRLSQPVASSCSHTDPKTHLHASHL